MKRFIHFRGLVSRCAFIFLCMQVQASDEVGTASVLETMENIIVPASDTLWGVDDPQTGEDWQRLETAAGALVNAGQAIKQGGSGPSDAAWASEAQWQELVSSMIQAAASAQTAVKEKNLDALLDAGDELYPPCESCHKLFNPAVVNQ